MQCVGTCSFWFCGIYGRCVEAQVDYSKYLGKDYTYTYEGSGMLVSNHITPMDVVIQWCVINPKASYLGKREALKIPGTKYIVGPLKFLVVGRDSKDS